MFWRGKFRHTDFAHENTPTPWIADLKRVAIDQAGERRLRREHVVHVDVTYDVPFHVYSRDERRDVSGQAMEPSIGESRVLLTA